MTPARHPASTTWSPTQVVLRSDRADRPVGKSAWLEFTEPLQIAHTSQASRVSELLREVSRANDQGLWAVGFVTYEASPGFDSRFQVFPATGLRLPVAWFAFFDRPTPIPAADLTPTGQLLEAEWRRSLSLPQYRRKISDIRRHIAAGDTYQANLTFPMLAPFRGDPWRFFQQLVQTQQGRYAAFIDFDRVSVCSASPELFFRSSGEHIECQPMKGTARRGLTWEQDQAAANTLSQSPKDQAENLMIVDMVRNDLGRIALPGTVQVRRLFEIERYPSVLQMTSTVAAQTSAQLPDIFGALFPCASITGAPKIRTMELIHQLEDGPRGIYTGAIGFTRPDRSAQFSVAIRTVFYDRAAEELSYGTGGGIVWDSDADREYEECATKALVLTRPHPQFELLETMRWTSEEGYFLLDRHLERLRRSARYFDFPVDLQQLAQELQKLSLSLEHRLHRIRLLVDANGETRTEVEPITEARRSWRLALASQPIDRMNPFLYHKTTHRQVYEEAHQRNAACDDVLLWNDAGELTEATRANLAVRIHSRWLTPPLECGLLPGVYRADLLERTILREARLKLDDLRRAEHVCLINSLRGWIPVQLQLPGNST